MAKHTFISHPFLSFRLKFDLEPARISLYLHLTRPFIHHIAHGDKRSSDCDRNIWDASIFTTDSQPGAGAGDSETMKIVFWFNLALHRIQLGRYKLICPCSLNSIFLFISTLHISNRLDLRICLAWLPVRERRGSNPADTIKCEGPGGSMQ